MASVQCDRPPAEQKNHHHGQSLGQKVSEMASRVMKREGHHGRTTDQDQTRIQSITETETFYNGSGAVAAKTQVTEVQVSHPHKKKGLIQKIKDGISRHHSEEDNKGSSSSSSDSDSESDNENRGKRTERKKL